MLNWSLFHGIYFYGGVVDFRKSIDGLSVLVQEAIHKDLYGPNLFLFLSRDRRKMKMLFWDLTGFALVYKRLEKDKFPTLRKREQITYELERQQLEWLLTGVDWWKIKKHQPVIFEKSA